MRTLQLLAAWFVAAACTACAGTAERCLQTPVNAKASVGDVELCRDALEANLERRDVFHHYLGLLRAREHYDDAILWSRRVLVHDASRTDALYNLAYALRKRGLHRQALEKYQAYAAANKGDPDPFYGMALCHEELGERQAARQAYADYLMLELRKSQGEWVARARARLAALEGSPQQNDSSSAQPPPTPAQVQGPAAPAPGQDPATSAPGQAPATSAPGQAPAAAPRLLQPLAAPVPAPRPPADCSADERAVQADPFQTAAYDRFAECAARNGHPDDVIRRLRIAVRDNPDYARGWLHLGRAYRAKGELPSAKQAFARACAAGVPEACGQ